MKREDKKHDPPELQSWLDTLPETERETLRRTWELFATINNTAMKTEQIDQAWAGVASATTRRTAMILLRAAAVTALLVAGFLAGRFTSDNSSTAVPVADDRPAYMVLLRGREADMPEDEHKRRVVVFTKWAQDLAQSGHLQDGNELAAAGYLLQPNQPEKATQFDEDVAGISGYFLLQAKDDAEAIALTKGCPQLGYGGDVELRKVGGR